jgi:hypothetical protein
VSNHQDCDLTKGARAELTEKLYAAADRARTHVSSCTPEERAELEKAGRENRQPLQILPPDSIAELEAENRSLHAKLDQASGENAALTATLSLAQQELMVYRKCDAILDAYPKATDAPTYMQLQWLIRDLEAMTKKVDGLKAHIQRKRDHLIILESALAKERLLREAAFAIYAKRSKKMLTRLFDSILFWMSFRTFVALREVK